LGIGALGIAALAQVLGCAPAADSDDDDDDGEVPSESALSTPLAPGATVEVAQASTCSTESIRPLALQLAAALQCTAPSTLVPIPTHANITLDPSVLGYLQPGAAKAVGELAKAGIKLRINSALRTLPQQYMVRRWAARSTCGVAKAAAPGRSKHEAGLALDLDNWSDAKKSLGAKKFAWFGAGDEVHFTYKGDDAKDLGVASVKAFQLLWNENHPGSRLPVDGDYSEQVEKRLKSSPAAGFPKGIHCQRSQP
jgi:hypothetical protein